MKHCSHLYQPSKTLALTLLLSFLTGCGLRPRTKTLTRKVSEPHQVALHDSEHFITVWIHGTRIFPPSMFQSIFKGKPGLKHITDIRHDSRLYTIADSLIGANPWSYSKENFYLFGWSGKLSFVEREKAAQTLYNELYTLVETYNQQGIEPSIRIIGHSHGGNVALNLAKCHEPPFSIAELILLACPVQGTTRNLIAHPLFEKVYSLYSKLDLVQVLDPQGLYHGESNSLFSNRLFPYHEKLAQLKVKFNGRAVTHTEFLAPEFLAYLPTIITEVEHWKQEHDNLSAWSHMNKLFCIYTDGRTIDHQKYHERNKRFMEICA